MSFTADHIRGEDISALAALTREQVSAVGKLFTARQMTHFKGGYYKDHLSAGDIITLATLEPSQDRAITRLTIARRMTHFKGGHYADHLPQLHAQEAERRNHAGLTLVVDHEIETAPFELELAA